LYLRLFWTLVASFGVLGACIAFTQPLFSVPDEFTHWNAGHSRLERLFGDDGCVPTFNPERRRRLHQPLPPFEKLRKTPLQCMNGEDLYGDILTYPGLVLSKVILPNQGESSIRQMQGIMLTRLLQGLVFVACLLRLGVHARRARRAGPLLVAAFAMSPLLAQQAFGVSADGAQLGFALCLLSALIFWDQLDYTDLALFILLGWGATAKPFVLTCVIPSVVTGHWYAQLRGGNNPGLREVLRRQWAALKLSRRPTPQTLVLWSAIVLSAATLLLALNRDDSNAAPATHVKGVDLNAQLAAIKADPATIFEITARQVPEPWLLRNYSGPLGWLDAPLSQAATNTFLQLIGLACVLELLFLAYQWRRSQGPNLRTSVKRIPRVLPPLLIGLLGPIANLFFIALVLYLTWTPVGAPHPYGLQSRYHFSSVIVLIGLVCGALGLVLEPDSEVRPEPAPNSQPASPRLRRWARPCAIWGPFLILALTLPYIARVFLDLEQRYR
jgi:hypothetical protein